MIPRAARRLAATLARLRGRRRLALAAALGAAGCAGFAPVHFPPALIAALAGLLYLVDGCRGPRGAFGVGLVFGFAHFAAGLYWVGNAFFVAGVAEWAAPFAVAGLAGMCAIFPAVSCAVYRALAPRGLWRAAVFASAWTAGEYLRGTLIMGGFPWNLAGYVWTPWPAAIQLAAVLGAYGLSALTAFAAGALAAFADRPRPWAAPAAAAALLAANAAAGAWTLTQKETAFQPDTRLRLVQANVAQHRKWREDLFAERYRRHEALSTQPATEPPTLVIWPETASPWDLSLDFPERAHAVRSVPPGGALVAGAVRMEFAPDGSRRIWNSIQALDPAGRVTAAYDKFHLVPFGEYSPLRGLSVAGLAMGGDAGFARGPGPRMLSAPGAPPFSPLICYEAIFPGAVTGPAARPQWLLNVTNDAWYGRSAGPYQHFEQARLRAVEEGLPLVRAANSGISGVIDPWGRVTARAPLGATAALDAFLPAPRPTATLFARHGNAPILALALIVMAVFAIRRRFGGTHAVTSPTLL